MSRPAVSVVMPVRDGASWVGAAIASIVGQPVDELELVVGDDGSTDETPAIVARWAEADARVRSVQGPERGPGAAFDAGVHNSRADVVARMDADDVALPWRIPRQLAFLREHPEVVMVGGFLDVMDPAGGLLFVERVPVLEPDIRRRLPAHCFFNPTLAFRRSALERVGAHRPIFGAADDVDFALRISDCGPVANLPLPLVRYRLHGSSASDTQLVHQALGVLVAQAAHESRVRGEDDPVDGALSLDEAAARLALDPGDVAQAVDRALTGRARMLAHAGLASRARDVARLVDEPGRKAQIARAARTGRAIRERDDYVGARRATSPGSALAVAFGLRRALTRCGTASRRIGDRRRRRDEAPECS